GVPLGLLILAVGLITVGGSLVIASGWRILVRTSFPSSCVPLESIGVSRTALGFTREVVASESMPPGYLFGRYKGEIEIVAPLGDWTVVEQYSTSAGWYRKHPAPEPSPLPH